MTKTFYMRCKVCNRGLQSLSRIEETWGHHYSVHIHQINSYEAVWGETHSNVPSNVNFAVTLGSCEQVLFGTLMDFVK